MPTYVPRKKYKFKCPQCGTEFFVTLGGYGDAIYRIEDKLKFILDQQKLENLKCPKCGAIIRELLEED